nr:mitochondrial inner membrane protein OXA1-like isoform X2 [Lolium perenne]
MAFAAAARRNLASRGLSGLLERRLRPSIHQLLPSNSTGEPRKPPPLPPQPAPRSFHFALAPCGTAQTLNHPPFGLHLPPGSPRRSFSSSSSRDFTDVLTDAAHAAAPAASFPGEVARAAEDSSMAVAAVQHLIDGVHSFTGLNWWISIALSTVLLRSVSFTLWMLARKQLYEMRQEVQQTSKLLNNAKDDASREEAERVVWSSLKKIGVVVYLPLAVTPYTLITLHIAISNMVENVPSLKGGGAFWFTDLTTPDAFCMFPMMTSLFIILTSELKYSTVRKCKGCSGPIDKVKGVQRVISLLSMVYTTSLPQAISCFFVTWSSLSLAERIALEQPAVQKVLFGAPLIKQRCSSCDGQNGPTAGEAPSPVKEQEEPVCPETKKSSDASIHSDKADKKSTKDS